MLISATLCLVFSRAGFVPACASRAPVVFFGCGHFSTRVCVTMRTCECISVPLGWPSSRGLRLNGTPRFLQHKTDKPGFGIGRAN